MSKLKAGDRVIVTGKYKDTPWIASMNKYIGKTGVVDHITNQGSCRVKIDDEPGDRYIYAFKDCDLIPHVVVPKELFKL